MAAINGKVNDPSGSPVQGAVVDLTPDATGLHRNSSTGATGIYQFPSLPSAYSAEYGRAMGGVVNTVTRSGTNSISGTAFWFFRNCSLDARDPFSTINPAEARHQFGGSIADPIIKSRLFFFLNTEEQQREFLLISGIINPSAIDANTHTFLGCGVASATTPAATPGQCAAINSTLTRLFGVLPRSAKSGNGAGEDRLASERSQFLQHFFQLPALQFAERNPNRRCGDQRRRNLRTPNSQQADISIQRALDSKTSITASYIWSRAAHLLTVRDLNVGKPTHSLTYNILDTTGKTVNTYTTPVYLATDRMDPRYSRVIGVDSGGNSYYSGLAIQVQRRMSKTFEGSLADTWSHAIENNPGNGGLSGSNSHSTLFNGNYQNEKGPSSLDIRQRLVINWIYSPVFSRRTDLLTRILVKNWQLADVTTISTGAPDTETLSISSALTPAQFAQAGLPANFAFTGGTINGFGGSNRVPFLGIGTLRLPNTYRTDVRLSKVLPFSERFRAT